MQTLRASAVALSFVALAVLVGLLSVIIGLPKMSWAVLPSLLPPVQLTTVDEPKSAPA